VGWHAHEAELKLSPTGDGLRSRDR
jgi:hypothetical protein